MQLCGQRNTNRCKVSIISVEQRGRLRVWNFTGETKTPWRFCRKYLIVVLNVIHNNSISKKTLIGQVSEIQKFQKHPCLRNTTVLLVYNNNTKCWTRRFHSMATNILDCFFSMKIEFSMTNKTLNSKCHKYFMYLNYFEPPETETETQKKKKQKEKQYST